MAPFLTRFFSFPGQKTGPKPPHNSYTERPIINLTDADLERIQRDACISYLLHRAQRGRGGEVVRNWVNEGGRREEAQQEGERGRGFPYGLGDDPDEVEERERLERERRETQKELKYHGYTFGFGHDPQNLESPSYTDIDNATSNSTPGSRISPGNVGYLGASSMEGSSVGGPSASNLGRPAPVSRQSAPAPVGRMLASSSVAAVASVPRVQSVEDNCGGLQQRDEKENRVDSQPNELMAQAINMLEMKDVSPGAGSQIIPERDVPVISGAEFAPPSGSYFSQNPDSVTHQEALPLSSSSPPLPKPRHQHPRTNTDQHLLTSPKSFHTAEEQNHTVATGSEEPFLYPHERKNRVHPVSNYVCKSCTLGGKIEPDQPVADRPGTGPNSDKGDGEVNGSNSDERDDGATGSNTDKSVVGVSEAQTHKPSAHSPINYKQILRHIKASSRSQDLKMDLAIELVSLLQEHKVQLLEEKAKSEAEKLASIEGWQNFYRLNGPQADVPCLHPNDLLIQGFLSLGEGYPFAELVVSQLRQDMETTNNARYRLKQLQKDRKFSQAPTLIGNQGSGSSGSESPKQVKKIRTASQNWKGTQKWATLRKLSINGWWPSIGRATKVRASVTDPGVFRAEAPRQSAHPVLSSSGGAFNGNDVSSTRALHSSQCVPGVNNPGVLANGQNASSEAPVGIPASGTSVDTVDLYSNNTTQANNLRVVVKRYLANPPRSSESAERVARDEGTFARLSSVPGPSERPDGTPIRSSVA